MVLKKPLLPEDTLNTCCSDWWPPSPGATYTQPTWTSRGGAPRGWGCPGRGDKQGSPGEHG